MQHVFYISEKADWPENRLHNGSFGPVNAAGLERDPILRKSDAQNNLKMLADFAEPLGNALFPVARHGDGHQAAGLVIHAQDMRNLNMRKRAYFEPVLAGLKSLVGNLELGEFMSDPNIMTRLKEAIQRPCRYKVYLARSGRITDTDGFVRAMKPDTEYYVAVYRQYITPANQTRTEETA